MSKAEDSLEGLKEIMGTYTVHKNIDNQDVIPVRLRYATIHCDPMVSKYELLPRPAGAMTKEQLNQQSIEALGQNIGHLIEVMQFIVKDVRGIELAALAEANKHIKDVVGALSVEVVK